MVRTQIQLTESQHARLKEWARQRGLSLAEAVRRCVDEKLASQDEGQARAECVRKALAVVGKYADPDGSSGVARDHDRHFAEAARR